MIKALKRNSKSVSSASSLLSGYRYHRTDIAMKVATADAIPRLPICPASISSFSCRGVSADSVANLAFVLPHL